LAGVAALVEEVGGVVLMSILGAVVRWTACDAGALVSAAGDSVAGLGMAGLGGVCLSF